MMNIYLKKGREKPVLNGHPWIFSGAIQKTSGEGRAGEQCRVMGNDGTVLGHGYYNAASSITVRMLTRGDVPFSPAMLAERLGRAIAARKNISPASGTDSCRFVNSEGDFLPGLLVDFYGSGICVQITTAGMELWREEIIRQLINQLSPAFIYERSDTESRTREGLGEQDGLLHGLLPESLVIRENGLTIGVDLAAGQKTGYFFDQRDNRALLRSYARGRECLDCFSYSGAFGCNMLAGDASAVTAVDISQSAVDWCRRNFEINGFAGSSAEFIKADAFDFLRETRQQYGCIVLDPPKFARHKADIPRAARGYKDINLVAIKNIASGGVLFTFSCSNAVDRYLFRQIVFAAAADAGKQVQVLHVLSAGPDHPVNIAHPEGDYLKGLVLKIT